MSKSEQLYARAQRVIPGGVNSPVRAFTGVGGCPIFFESGKGAYVTDVDGKEYIDYVGSWGPLILGHCPETVIAAVSDALRRGMSFGAPTELEIRLAEKIVQLMPGLDKVRMVNSGTEATMTAVRLARGVTGKNKIIKFNGCYHGHNDSLLVKAGSGLLTLGIPATPGIPGSITEHTLTADFNNLEQIAHLFERYSDDIAAVILEPIAANMGLVLPQEGFLAGLRELCDQYGALLIFDEVITGFRVALGGAQELYGIQADLTTFGKIIGGGMPVGALGGRAEWMAHLAPEGPVYQAGTLSGNPLAMAAGLATLEAVSQKGFYDRLGQTTRALANALQDAAQNSPVPFKVQSVGGLFGLYFSELESIENYEDVAKGDLQRFQKFFHGMLQQGVYLAPSMFEAGFVSSAHGEEEIRLTQQAAAQVLRHL